MLATNVEKQCVHKAAESVVSDDENWRKKETNKETNKETKKDRLLITLLCSLGVELRRAQLDDTGPKAYYQAPLAAAIRSMYDLEVQHHSQMEFGWESIF